MGWGGILGAIAQGLGTGMMTNAKEGYEDERLQKQLDWKSAMLDKELDFKKGQAGLDRDHDFAVIQAKERSEIAVAAARSAIDIKEYKQKLALGGGRGGSGSTGKNANANDFQGLMQGLEVNRNAIAAITDQIEAQGGEATEKQQADLDFLQKERSNLLYSETAANADKNMVARQFLIAHGRRDPVSKEQALSVATDSLAPLVSWGSKTAGRPEVPSPVTSTVSSITPSEVEISAANKELYQKYKEAGKKREELNKRIENTPHFLNKYGVTY